jgi:hypothetical protein
MMSDDSHIEHPFILVSALLGLGSVGAHGCSQARTCGHRTVPAPAVTVTDAASGNLICDATVTATLLSEDATFVLPAVPATDASACYYYLEGPPGTYNIMASRAGYQPAVVNGFVELSDVCGALGSNPSGQTVTIMLTRG